MRLSKLNNIHKGMVIAKTRSFGGITVNEVGDLKHMTESVGGRVMSRASELPVLHIS